MSKKKVTFSDIAAYTGFSKTTISRYFNDPDSVTLDNQAIIRDALEKLDYRENKLARVLANGKSEFVGIIIPTIYLEYYAEMLNEILTSYEQFGYKFLVFISDQRRESEDSYIKELLGYEVEGIIDLSHTIPSEELASYGIPVVTIEREDRCVTSVNTDNYGGGRQAAELLLESGCTELFHINYDNIDPGSPTFLRIDGFRDACIANGARHELILKDLGGDFSSNRRILREILADILGRFPTAKKGISLSNDIHANILLNLVFEQFGGLPDDLCIVGFDNTPVSRQSVIPISTIGQQIPVMAKEAMELLVAQMNERKKRAPKKPGEPVHKVIPTEVHRRSTTK